MVAVVLGGFMLLVCYGLSAGVLIVRAQQWSVVRQLVTSRGVQKDVAATGYVGQMRPAGFRIVVFPVAPSIKVAHHGVGISHGVYAGVPPVERPILDGT